MAEVKVAKGTQELARPGFWDMPFTGVQPFNLMRRFSDELDRFFGNGPFSGEEFEKGLWRPALEVSRANGTLKVKAELPGLKKEEIHVEAVEGGLVIQGERKEEKEEKKEGFFRSERSYGKFYRSIALPEGADLEKAKAEYTNGVLEISIPVPEVKAKKKEIPVEVKAA